MLIYAPATPVGPPGRRRAELLPATLRLLARGISAGAFCWDSTGQLKPAEQVEPMLQHQLHVADLGIIHVVAAEVDEAAWLYATDVMGGRLEAPWATSLTGLAHACADSATAIRRRSATARSLSAGDSAATDALALMSLWVPGVAQTQQRVREHYSAALDESAETTYPAWLLDGITPGVAAARAFLASTPADSAHPLRVADDVWVLAVCDRIAAMSD